MQTFYLSAALAMGLATLAQAQVSLNVCNDCTDGVAGGTCTDIVISGCTATPGTQCFRATDGSPVTDTGVVFFNSGGCNGNSHRADQCEVQSDGYCVAAGTESISYNP